MAWNTVLTASGASAIAYTDWNTMSGLITSIISSSTTVGSTVARQGGGTLVGISDTQTLTNKTLTSPALGNTNISGVKEAVFNGIIDDGNSSTSDTIDWTTGSIHKSTLTGNCTYTFTAPTGVSRVTLQVVQGSGPYTVTWPAAVKWTGAAAPTLGTTNGRSDWITFIWDGTNYWGVASTNFN